MHLTRSKGTLDEGSSPSCCAGRKLGDVEQALLWTLLHEDPACPTRVLLDKVAQRQRPRTVSVRHRNRWRAPWRLTRRKGRPRQAAGRPPVVSGAALGQVTPRLSFVGGHLLAHWLDQQETFGPVVAQLTPAIAAHKRAPPDDAFALVPHREQTLLRRFEALCFAPLFGIDTRTAFDPPEPPLPTLLGRGDHRSTLSQFLGPLERIDAASALMSVLVPHPAGQITDGDGHRIASWSRMSMHKGPIPMRGRILAGSQAIIAPNEAGQALFVADHPPDLPLSQGIVAYCPQVALATGTSLFVLDRAVNAVAMARAVDHQGWGRLCLLDDNEPQGLERFEAPRVGTRAEGTPV